MSLSLCFPTPLPDETIYSLFCRYHVRSCNASNNTTIHQLFNKKRSMQTTVFSAFPLKHARHLEESFHGISIESLLQKNTAMPFYRVFKPRTNTSCHSYASDRFLMAMYNNCCTFTKKLRYYPKCAEAQYNKKSLEPISSNGRRHQFHLPFLLSRFSHFRKGTQYTGS